MWINVISSSLSLGDSILNVLKMESQRKKGLECKIQVGSTRLHGIFEKRTQMPAGKH